jgi:hypothetical protein
MTRIAMRARRCGRTGRLVLLAFVALSVGRPESASGATWMAAARDQLYCLQDATPRDRASLPTAPAGATANDGLKYWTTPLAGPIDRLQRYLMLLATLGYLADRDDDQALHRQVLLLIATQANNDRVSDADLRQVTRCAHASLLTIAVEQDDALAVDGMIKRLILQYHDAAIGPAAEDLPIIRALRDVSLAAHSEAFGTLTGLAVVRGHLLQAADPGRASRLLAAVADALVAAGDPRRAWGLVLEANRLIADRPASIEDRWRTFPASYDSQRAENGQTSATILARAMLQRFPFPPHDQLVDLELEFNVCLRLYQAERLAAQPDDDYARVAAWRMRASQALIDESNHAPLPMPFLRAAFASLTREGTQDGVDDTLAAVWARDKALARHNYETAYRPELSTLQAHALALPFSDARARLHFAWQVSNWLAALSQLAEVLPDKRTEIAGQVFEAMQLQADGRLAAAAIQPLLKGAWPERVRQDLARFVGNQTNWNPFLRRVLSRAYLSDPVNTADAEKMFGTFKTLDITYNESTKALADFRASVGQSAPALAALLNPVPLSLPKLQAGLGLNEALVSVVTTTNGVFLLSANAHASSFRRVPIQTSRLEALVRRLRASLLPRTGATISVSPFDARAAFEIYTATIGLTGDVTRGTDHLFWYANGALASLPPAVLVRHKPPSEQVSASVDLRRLDWEADAHAFSILPEPGLFAGYRTAAPKAAPRYAFIGIGAPGLSPGELEGARTARSNDLAGGLDGRALASLPKLPETATELRRLAATLGEDRSLLLLGGDASKTKVRETLQSATADVLAFATHGFVAGEIAGISEASLLLDAKPQETEEAALLTMSEIAELQIDGSLVILSACNTATSDGRPRGESFTGLAKSFTQAGARALLVSHWPVASGPASDLSVRTLELSRKNGLPLAKALAQAMRELRTTPDEGAVSTAHPFYWAPFVFVGDGARIIR